jgi:hypothetical protein
MCFCHCESRLSNSFASIPLIWWLTLTPTARRCEQLLAAASVNDRSGADADDAVILQPLRVHQAVSVEGDEYVCHWSIIRDSIALTFCCHFVPRAPSSPPEPRPRGLGYSFAPDGCRACGRTRSSMFRLFSRSKNADAYFGSILARPESALICTACATKAAVACKVCPKVQISKLNTTQHNLVICPFGYCSWTNFAHFLVIPCDSNCVHRRSMRRNGTVLCAVFCLEVVVRRSHLCINRSRRFLAEIPFQ